MFHRTLSAPVRRLPSAVVAGCLLAASLPLADAASAAETDAGDSASMTQGVLYGTVTTTKGKTYKGVLRWDDEEAFWDDHFNSGKVDLPYLKEFKDEGRSRSFEIFGRKINVNWGNHQVGRQFVSRFGDLQKIRVIDDSEAELTMRDGTVIGVEGVGNDVEATIKVLDAALGELEADWEAIETIEFEQAPPDTQVFGARLWGSVETSAGTFEGFVQWDKQECLSIDKLDGEEDGVKLSLDFGQIRSITKDSRRNGSVVTLRDGRTLNLEDSNDVDDDNRGILIEDSRYGRVEVPWYAFETVEFRTDRGSGAPYASFAEVAGPLRGEVIDRSGQRRSGQLVYDLDESYRWELLDGISRKVTYSIPFFKIREIAPRGAESTLVTLTDGSELKLSDSHDVDENNEGVLILDSDGEGGILVPWDEVSSVRFVD